MTVPKMVGSKASCLIILITLINAAADTFDESVHLIPLYNKLVHANFKFVVSTSPISLASGHYLLFPKALGEIIEKYNVQELDLSLTQGNWRYSQWGIPSEGSANPSGASILALFKSSTQDVDIEWKGLVNSLSGLICASLNFVDKSVTTIPKYTFYPRGAFSADETFNNSYIRYANLPQENVCTENLTPWKKLLPCTGKVGLSSLLNPKSLYDSHYHSLSLTVRPECASPNCNTLELKLIQSLSVVLGHNRNFFSFKSLFARSVKQPCHIATNSELVIHSPDDGPLSLTLDPPANDTVQQNGNTASTYKSVAAFNVKATYRVAPTYTTAPLPAIHFQRYLTGYGQEYGSIVCEITNNGDEHVQIVYTEYVPWYLRLYLHTLSIKSEGIAISPAKMSYSPGLERKKPYLIELLLTIPANATTVISFDVDKLFLKWTEYNPDASLGFYTPAAVITVVLPDAQPETTIQMMKEDYGVIRLYTEKLLVLLPTPDFSMPYNVICLACTVVALAFGSFHNLTTKILVRETEPPQPLSQRVKKFLMKVFGIKEVEEKKNVVAGEEIEDEEEENGDEGVEHGDEGGEHGDGAAKGS